ncbi:MAG: acetoacetate decarboxylase family protein [Pseudomonadota bacterium]
MKGFIYPRTATGGASILPSPPWHYTGTLMTFEYRSDVAAVKALLPDGVELADEDPGAVALIWAEWQSCGNDFEELQDPIRAQYKEAFVVIRCKFDGVTYSRCAFIWVDKDYAMVRGILQGYPKRIGSIYMTWPARVGKGGPKLAPGGQFAATLAANDRRLAHGRLTITGESDHNGFVNGHPMLHSRYMPSIEIDGTDSLNELVAVTGYDAEIGQTFKGDFELDLLESPSEELHLLPIREKIGAYWREIGVSWKEGKTVWRENL